MSEKVEIKNMSLSGEKGGCNYSGGEEGLLLDEQAKDVLREEAVAYGGKRQGEYTIEDYYALPEDFRAELIDGVIIEMNSPTSIHQIIGFQIAHKLANYIEKKNGKCVALCSPLDVQLDGDNRTIVQPDVIVLCDMDKLYRNVLFGAPDFVVEILSKSTERKDRILKLRKYREAGVKEYWMVDPDKQKVIVYIFGKENQPSIYGFEDEVPVGIFAGECTIRFAKIYEKVRFLYGRDGR